MKVEDRAGASHSVEASLDNTDSRGKRGNVLLLQGPVGPFFRHLRFYLEKQGYTTWRVCFNAADRIFALGNQSISFFGDLGEWKRWFSDFVSTVSIDYIILFGAARPVHRVARSVAGRFGIRVISLEEGYLRPGYITAEQGGNNSTSPLAGRVPDLHEYGEAPDEIDDPDSYSGFKSMCVYGGLYYAVRTFFTVGKCRQLFHRGITPHSELFCWLRNGWRRLKGRGRNYRIVEKLLEHHDGKYYLVPLQVSSDAQMQRAALGWSSLKLISAVLKSFAGCAPLDSRLIFKIHPLERGHCNDGKLIHDTARAYGIEDRVDVVDIGSIGLLTRHSAGVITINSTSGLSAIYHGVPLKVVGSAIYAHPELAVCAQGKPDFDSFWYSSHVGDARLRQAYLNWIKQEALMGGDFYDKRGMRTACRNIGAKMKSMPVPDGSATRRNRFIFSTGVKASRVAGLVLACCTLLSGCGTLPGSGPSRREISQFENDEPEDREYSVIELNVDIAEKLGDPRPVKLNEAFSTTINGKSESVLGVGDHLVVNIWEASGDGLFSTHEKKQSSIDSMVDESGAVFIPYVGQVPVAGKTIEAVRQTIQAGLEGKAVEPQVQVALAKNVSNNLVVVGDVNEPGRYPLPIGGLRLLDVVATAGGSQSAIYESEALLVRGDIHDSIRLDEVIGRNSNNVWMMPNDTVQIMHRPRSFSAFGAVSKKNRHLFKTEHLTLAEALAESGGLNDGLADAGGIFLFRFEEADVLEQAGLPVPETRFDGKVATIYSLDFEQPEAFFLARSFAMQDKDLIYVANAFAAEYYKFIRIYVQPLLDISRTSTVLIE